MDMIDAQTGNPVTVFKKKFEKHLNTDLQYSLIFTVLLNNLNFSYLLLMLWPDHKPQ